MVGAERVLFKFILTDEFGGRIAYIINDMCKLFVITVCQGGKNLFWITIANIAIWHLKKSKKWVEFEGNKLMRTFLCEGQCSSSFLFGF